MKKQTGYLLLALGIAGLVVLFNFWEATSYPGQFFAVSVVVILAGLYLLLKIKIKQFTTTANEEIVVPREQLRTSGISVKLTLDNCEVKSRSFRQEIEGDTVPADVEMIDGLIDPERNYYTEEVRQTYVVHEALYKGVPHKFISHATSMDEVSARMLIDSQGGVLYVDRKDPNHYFFELPF